MKLSLDAICHRGPVRENNEDALSLGGLILRDSGNSLTVTVDPDGSFYLLVSDGMGGHEKGEEASSYTLSELDKAFSDGEIGRESFEDDIRSVVARISSELNARAAQMGQEYPMGCTLTGVVWHYGHIWLINAGDSRTYRFRGGMLRLLTTDDTERGLTGDPNASKLLHNCVGGGCEGLLTITPMDGKFLPNDIILVCSDGLTDMVTEENIEAALEGGSCAADLFKMACEGGGADNISIILSRIIEA